MSRTCLLTSSEMEGIWNLENTDSTVVDESQTDWTVTYFLARCIRRSISDLVSGGRNPLAGKGSWQFLDTPHPILFVGTTDNSQATITIKENTTHFQSKDSTMKLQAILFSLSAISAAAFVPNLPQPAFRTLPLFVASVEEATLDSEERMAKSIDSVLQNLGTVRTGRANPSMLDRVKVDYYGAPTPISQLAGISVPSAQQLTVDPYDKKALGDIERAIIDAELGLTPMNDGNIIRLNIPALTEDRRKEMLKQCKAIGEEGKVAIRNIRRSNVDAVKKLEKSADISEDQSKDAQDAIQKLTDKKVKEIETIVEKKEKEVMTV
jgi:ribosome recycling factor